MVKKELLLQLFFSLIMANILFAGTLKTISTFESIGVYWTPDSLDNHQQALVGFREIGSSEWREGLPMIYKPIGGTTYELSAYRGSIVKLTPNTTYEIKLTLEDTSISDTILAKTWSEEFPIADTIVIGDRSVPYTFYNSGTADGYVLIDGTGSTIDVNNNHDYCINVRGSYVIFRGFTLKDGKKGGIEIKTCHNVVIENCDISGWGEKNSDGFGLNYQAGIFSESSSISRIVVQRCKIHHPRYDSNSWAESNEGGYHPSGPQGITFFNSGGNNVIRYNEIWSDSEHMYNDILGGNTNGSYRGFPGPDSDIYSNYLANCWDDGIESEGGNRNTRIWGNYTEETFLPIANAATSLGPLYIWKNISGRCYGPPGSYYGQNAPFIKMGFANSIDWMTGHMYIFNNTILQPNGEGAGGLGTSDSNNRYIRHCHSLNNILDAKSKTVNTISIRSENVDNSYDYDLYNGGIPSGEESHGIKGTPTYIDGAEFDRENLTANFFLSESSLGYDAGVVIPNFNDTYNGSAPDMGAFEAGDEPMEYGVEAYIITGVDEKDLKSPDKSSLFQNYPNPFNPTTVIRFSIPEKSYVKLSVYNLLGEKITDLVNGNLSAGFHEINFNVSTGLGTSSSLASGMYIYRILATSSTNSYLAVKKMVFLK